MSLRALAIRWEDGKHEIQKIRRSKSVLLPMTPRRLEPGRTVAIVQSNGVVALLFRCKEIVPLAYGARIMADPRTIRAPHGSDPPQLSIKWRAIPQLRYYDEQTHRPLNLSGRRREPGEAYLPDKVPAIPQPGQQRYGGEMPGRAKNNPEARLINAYRQWMGEPERFRDPPFLPPLYTDLLDRRYWRLLEAKNSLDRRTLREAVGQLLDYKLRFPRRRPSLGILLPRRPTPSDILYLQACGMTVIWRTPRGRFGDSTGSRAWTRREA